MSDQPAAPSRIPAPTPPASSETGRSLLERALNEAATRDSDQPSATATDPAAPTATPQGGQSPAPGPVPYDRFTEVNERAKRAEAELAELRKFKEDAEAAKLTEIERAQREREVAEQRAEQAERRALELERTGLIRDAATKAGFADPSDAVAFLTSRLDEIDTPDAATAAVGQLAQTKKHLLAAPAQPSAPAPIGGLVPHTAPGDLPVGPDGQPDVKAGLGRDLLASLTGRK